MGRRFIEWFTSVFLNTISLLIVAQLFDGFYIANFQTALLASVILSILNFIVRPILFILTIPITIITLGLFVLVINAITLMMTQSLMGNGFVIHSFGVAIIASILISIISVILHKMIGEPNKSTRR